MKVFLDECIDWRLSRDLADHCQVMTARQMGWTSIKNGELLALASREFDVFVTVDRNLSFQQNLEVLPIAVVVLSAPTNRLADLRPLVPRLSAAIASASPRKGHHSERRLAALRDLRTGADGVPRLRRLEVHGRESARFYTRLKTMTTGGSAGIRASA